MNGVVVGVDGSQTSLKAARQAAATATALGVPLHIVTAVKHEGLQTVTNGYDVFVNDPVQVATQLLDSVRVSIGMPTATTAQLCGSPARAICAEAERMDAQLIMVGNRRVKGAARVLGCVATDVLRNAHCDVQVVNTTAPEPGSTDTSPDGVHSLSTGSVFAGYTPDQRRQIDALATSIRVPAGRKLTEQGRLGREFGVLLDGSATVSIDGEDVARLGPGDHFGELALLDVTAHRAATVVADCDLQIAVMSVQEFATLVADFTDIEAQLERRAAGYSAAH